MSHSKDSRQDPRAKILSMMVRYKSATVAEFLENHSRDISRGGLFIKTPAPFPAGTLLKFELRIADEQRVMMGVGRVAWKREAALSGERPAGMGVKFIKIDGASVSFIDELVDQRAGEDSGFEAGAREMGIGLSAPPPDLHGPVSSLPPGAPSIRPRFSSLHDVELDQLSKLDVVSDAPVASESDESKKGPSSSVADDGAAEAVEEDAAARTTGLTPSLESAEVADTAEPAVAAPPAGAGTVETDAEPEARATLPTGALPSTDDEDDDDEDADDEGSSAASEPAAAAGRKGKGRKKATRRQKKKKAKFKTNIAPKTTQPVSGGESGSEGVPLSEQVTTPPKRERAVLASSAIKDKPSPIPLVLVAALLLGLGVFVFLRSSGSDRDGQTGDSKPSPSQTAAASSPPIETAVAATVPAPSAIVHADAAVLSDAGAAVSDDGGANQAQHDSGNADDAAPQARGVKGAALSQKARRARRAAARARARKRREAWLARKKARLEAAQQETPARVEKVPVEEEPSSGAEPPVGKFPGPEAPPAAPTASASGE